LAETALWADYLAIVIPRNAIASMPETLKPGSAPFYSGYTLEILVETPLPCGGMADCGICTVHMKKGYQLACKDGPVFDGKLLLK
jgi:dihydroorotate dehydrogenase electron transfer subunit